MVEGANLFMSASDGSDDAATDEFDLTINAAPQILVVIPDQTFVEGDDPFTQNLETVFSDEDALTFSAASSNEAVVLAAGDTFEVCHRIPLGESSYATPAVAGGVMYLRTSSHLFSLGGPR